MEQPLRAEVLIVDDDPVMRESLGDLLEAMGYGVTSAADGIDALGYLHSHEAPDLILCDLMMPRMNGWVFAMEKQRDPELAEIPTVMVSGKEHPQPAAEYLGAAGYIEKPMDPAVLVSLLRHHCGQRATASPTRYLVE